MTLRILSKVQAGELDSAMAMQLLGKGVDAGGSLGLPKKRPLEVEPKNAPEKVSEKVPGKVTETVSQMKPEQDEIDTLLEDAKKAKADTLLNLHSFFVIYYPFIFMTTGNNWDL